MNFQQCVAVSCDEPPAVDHAFPQSGHRLFGDVAYYYCSDGYSLAGNSQLLCNAQGKWVPPDGKDIPECIADFCERPLSVSYSILESSNKARYAAGSVVSFKCMEGFVLNTSAKIECVRSGQWNPSPLTIQCIPVRCGDPPAIKNGYASGSNYSFGAIVAYSCHTGYYIKGQKKRTCEATGTWSGTLPTCHPVSCGEPPKLANGFAEVLLKPSMFYATLRTLAWQGPVSWREKLKAYHLIVIMMKKPHQQNQFPLKKYVYLFNSKDPQVQKIFHWLGYILLYKSVIRFTVVPKETSNIL